MRAPGRDGRCDGERSATDRDSYPDLVQLNTKRTLTGAVGKELLERTVADHLAIAGTAVTIFESNGDYATATPPRGWCAVMDQLSRPACDPDDAMEAIDSGVWSCRASCREPALEAMRSGSVVETPCPGGMRVRAVPIRAGDSVVGAISYGCGGAPSSDRDLGAIAERLHVRLESLQHEASASTATSPESEAAMARGIDASAALLGSIVEHVSGEQSRDRARSAAIGAIAHDLRSPLSTIALAISALARKLDPQGPERRLSESMRRSAQTMSRLVDDLLDVTRARAHGTIPLDLEPYALDAICADAVADLRPLYPNAVVTLWSSGDARVRLDVARMRRVVTNLLVNAVRHGGGGAIELRVWTDAESVALSIHNDGPPIPPEVLPTIFEAFDQGRPHSDRERAEGVGLGLFIVREIARAHGARLEVTSDATSGTTFVVGLPRRG